MDRTRYVTLAAVAFGLVVLGFVVMGTTRLVLPYRTARTLAAPAMLGALVLAAYLFVRGVLDLTGVYAVEE